MEHVTIVIPCYNEEKRLPLDNYTQFLSGSSANILFVDDGSSDQTLKVLENLQESFPDQVRILHLHINMGKAEAVRRGILEVKNIDHADIVGFMDADLSTPFEEISFFLDAFKDNKIDFVFGSRISRIGAQIKRFNYRHYFGRVVATLVSIYLKIPVYDSQCGAKFFHADLASRLFVNPFVSKWLFDVEIFRRMALLGINVEECAIELPLHTWIEKGGSKIRISDYLKLPFEFYRIAHHYVTKKNLDYIARYSIKPKAKIRVIPEKKAETAGHSS
jgi:glycosyltransferase involved in cell wall biosynthesis